MKKRMALMIIALIIIFGGVFGWDFMRSYFAKQYMAHFRQPPVTISAATVKLKKWQGLVPAVGTLYSYESVNISPQQAGQVQEIYFKSGDIVQKGQPLLGQNIELNIQTLKSQQAQLALSKITYERYIPLAKKSFVSQSQLDQALAQYQEDEANVGQSEEIINEKTIRAPFTGKIGIRKVNLGQYVSPGDKLTSLQSLDPLRAVFYVPEQYFPDIKVGQAVKVTVEAYPGKEFPGKVVAINSQINSNTRNFSIEANIPNKNLELFPGMFANVTVILPAAKNVMVLPQTAISYNLYGNIVYVLTPAPKGYTIPPLPKKDRVKIQSNTPPKTVYIVKTAYVKTGEQRGNTVEILSGLKVGDLVATSGQLKLLNDTPVVINNSINPAIMPAVINAEE
ncbi:MAG: hypothetical protein A3E87_03670 [Gammaproteobacteria bacterium RIFCSPHIGHO2_12_FULL_35_23]|nr:MAG: hypothetical protein A3E87_03670 [Gammaproteobacteria bacterium RIFCSPHIGHO2_12_FULL_35_23]